MLDLERLNLIFSVTLKLLVATLLVTVCVIDIVNGGITGYFTLSLLSSLLLGKFIAAGR